MGLYSNFAKAPVHSMAWGGDGNVAMILPLSTDRKGLKAVDTEQGKDWTSDLLPQGADIIGSLTLPQCGDENVVTVLPFCRDRNGLKSVATERGQNWSFTYFETDVSSYSSNEISMTKAMV